MKELNDISYNPFGLAIGDIITATNVGIHEIVGFELKEASIEVSYNQLFTMDGKEVKMNRPAKCDLRECKPAQLQVAKLKERIVLLENLVRRIMSI